MTDRRCVDCDLPIPYSTEPLSPRCAIPACEKASRSRGWCEKHYTRWQRTGDPEGLRRTHYGEVDANSFYQFYRRVESTGCWIWTGALHKGWGSYGTCGQGYAHRLSWKIHHGDIPPGLYVCHRCDNPPCVNPDHLFLGNAVENMRDAVDKGRVPRGERHCCAKLTERAVRLIRRRAANGELQVSLAAEFGVTQSAIHLVVRRMRWGWLT